jgi:GT2 family glycosyltransferase/glycosyltransferase involved in cell wall biosynthesis
MGRTIKLIAPWSRRRGVVHDISANFVSSSVPIVSIIIPIHGKIDITLDCLRSISANPQKTNFEIIIVDDFSPDSSGKWLSRIPGIRVIANSENKGFIESCNVGAAAGKGKFLHFLNNDTLVTPNWLDELVETFSSHTNVGMVGSKLLYPDGKLQEAGGIVWKDGSAWNYGRFDDPNKPEYNYARQVDYCSGASLLIEKDLFFSFDGFDKHFLPAYCEDSDLAMKVTQSGLRVIYQPASAVYHLEGATSGTNLESGAKSYQVTNSLRLAQRWSFFLKDHRDNGEDVLGEKDRFSTMRVLFVDESIPKRDQDAGSLTAINTMILLREFGFQVTFATYQQVPADKKYVSELQKLGIEVLHSPFMTDLKSHLGVFGNQYDLFFVCRADTAEKILPLVRQNAPGKPVVYHTIDLHFLRLQRQAALFGDWSARRESEMYEDLESWLINHADCSIVHSDVEKDFLITRGVNTERVIVWPLILDVPSKTPTFAERDSIVFLAGFQHPPNVDAIQSFCATTMPLVLELDSEIVLKIVGTNIPDSVRALESANVKVVGFVEDIDAYISKSRLTIAPLRYGAGVKGKVGKSLVNGTPVVASTIATEGMGLMQEEGHLLCDTPEAFAQQIVRAYRDEELWVDLSASGKAAALRLWGPKASAQKLSTTLSKVGIPNNIPAKIGRLF